MARHSRRIRPASGQYNSRPQTGRDMPMHPARLAPSRKSRPRQIPGARVTSGRAGVRPDHPLEEKPKARSASQRPSKTVIMPLPDLHRSGADTGRPLQNPANLRCHLRAQRINLPVVTVPQLPLESGVVKGIPEHPYVFGIRIGHDVPAFLVVIVHVRGMIALVGLGQPATETYTVDYICKIGIDIFQKCHEVQMYLPTFFQHVVILRTELVPSPDVGLVHPFPYKNLEIRGVAELLSESGMVFLSDASALQEEIRRHHPVPRIPHDREFEVIGNAHRLENIQIFIERRMPTGEIAKNRFVDGNTGTFRDMHEDRLCIVEWLV